MAGSTGDFGSAWLRIGEILESPRTKPTWTQARALSHTDLIALKYLTGTGVPVQLPAARDELNIKHGDDDLSERAGAQRVLVHRRLRRTSTSTVENFLNESRKDELEREFTSALLTSLRQESVSPGVVGQADALVSRSIAQNRLATLEWLNSLYLRFFDNTSVAADLLMLVGRLPYETANPFGVTMALGGLTHKSPAVQEAAIRAFERWANKESLQVLKQVHFQADWLKDYADDVISDLENA